MKQQGFPTAWGGRPGLFVHSRLYGAIPLDFLVKGESHPCPYLPGREACEEAFKVEQFPPELYHDFMDSGFRRSGLIIYRPACRACTECRPLRVAASRFAPSKSQRRVLRKNEDIEVAVALPRFTRDKFRMYSDYVATQHVSFHDDTAENMKRFLYSSPVLTLEFEYRLRARLVAVGIADLSSPSLSSVYAFYDPDLSARSLGTLSALREIAFCRSRSVPYYYLGFLVAGSPSMNYKARFRPHEILSPEGEWVSTGGLEPRTRDSAESAPFADHP
ncbi:MAG: arginyltransferase [Deltaproteobacteria bacterium]